MNFYSEIIMANTHFEKTPLFISEKIKCIFCNSLSVLEANTTPRLSKSSDNCLFDIIRIGFGIGFFP
jgi:hypothetical protein